MIENGRRRGESRGQACEPHGLRECSKAVYKSTRRRETGRIFSLYLEQSPREVAGEVQYPAAHSRRALRVTGAARRLEMAGGGMELMAYLPGHAANAASRGPDLILGR